MHLASYKTLTFQHFFGEIGRVTRAESMGSLGLALRRFVQPWQCNSLCPKLNPGQHPIIPTS